MKTMSKTVLMIAFASFCMMSCTNNTTKNKAEKPDLALISAMDSSSQTIKFDNALFSVPSPYQLTMMLKSSGLTFNENLLNPIANNQNYNTNFKKCVNLGVYGADLAYLNINEQFALVVNSFSVTKLLANDLGLMATFSKDLIDRIETNFETKDSLLHILTNTYRDVDVFLKESQRQKEGALVLAGGWVESMYMLSQMAIESMNDELIQRIGESKQPLENLIKILSPYSSDNSEISSLFDSLVELSNAYETVEQSYTYAVPEIDAENKLTIIKSKTSVIVTESDLLRIADEIKSIRTSMVE